MFLNDDPYFPELGQILWQLMKNVTYMCLVLGFSFRMYTIVAYYIFVPKYMEAQFYMTASQANTFSGK